MEQDKSYTTERLGRIVTDMFERLPGILQELQKRVAELEHFKLETEEAMAEVGGEITHMECVELPEMGERLAKLEAKHEG